MALVVAQHRDKKGAISGIRNDFLATAFSKIAAAAVHMKGALRYASAFLRGTNCTQPPYTCLASVPARPASTGTPMSGNSATTWSDAACPPMCTLSLVLHQTAY